MSPEELKRLSDETINYYEDKFMSNRERVKNVDGIDIPQVIYGFEPLIRGKCISIYLNTWEFFRGSLDPKLYHDYAEIVYHSQKAYYEWLSEGGEEVEIDFNLKRCILSLIDMELDDLRVEVKKLKKNSKYSTGGVSVKAGEAVLEIKNKVLSLVIDRKIELVEVENTKCHLLTYLKT